MGSHRPIQQPKDQHFASHQMKTDDNKPRKKKRVKTNKQFKETTVNVPTVDPKKVSDLRGAYL